MKLRLIVADLTADVVTEEVRHSWVQSRHRSNELSCQRRNAMQRLEYYDSIVTCL